MINSVHFLLGAMLPCSTPFCTSDPAGLIDILAPHKKSHYAREFQTQLHEVVLLPSQKGGKDNAKSEGSGHTYKGVRVQICLQDKTRIEEFLKMFRLCQDKILDEQLSS